MALPISATQPNKFQRAIESLVFGNRGIVLILFAIVTIDRKSVV